MAASFASDRFGYELCHRGLPLKALMIGVPVIGAACGAWAALRLTRAWLKALAGLAVAANGYKFVIAMLLLTGVGIAACG